MSAKETKPRRRWIIALVVVLAFIGLSAWAYRIEQSREARDQEQLLREFVMNSRDVINDEPVGGLAPQWFDCLQRMQSGELAAAPRVICESWTAQGVTSTLLALRFDNKLVPVVESKLAGRAVDGRLAIELVGGPGGTPFYSNPAITEEMVETFRDADPDGALSLVGGIMEDHPLYQLLQRGFTIASPGYWGTRFRSLNEPDEIELAISDVQLVLGRYREELGRDPALITESMGNHVALGALGEDRLESMDVLAVVPVMDGLQHHLMLVGNQPDPEDPFYEEWKRFNFYRRTEDGVMFDREQQMQMKEFVVQYMGEADFPWRDITPASPCSRILLGSEDPRTAAYLEATDDLPPFVSVWEAGHDLFREAPEQSRAAMAEFGDCLLTSPR